MKKFQMKKHKREKKYVNEIDNPESNIKDYKICTQNIFYCM